MGSGRDAVLKPVDLTGLSHRPAGDQTQCVLRFGSAYRR
jgi:hypothetical protein